VLDRCDNQLHHRSISWFHNQRSAPFRNLQNLIDMYNNKHLSSVHERSSSSHALGQSSTFWVIFVKTSLTSERYAMTCIHKHRVIIIGIKPKEFAITQEHATLCQTTSIPYHHEPCRLFVRHDISTCREKRRTDRTYFERHHRTPRGRGRK
jgi:hypothetical protein